MCTCRPTAGGAPSRLDASPRSHRSWSLTNNHHNCISLGRAMGLWVIAVGVRPTIITTAIHKSPKRYRICCALTNIAQLCVLHTLPPSPKKKGCVASVSPDTPRMKKTVHVPVPFAPLSLTCLDSFPDPYFGPPTTTESLLSTKVVTHSGSGIQWNRPTRHRMPPGRTNKPNPQDTP